MENLCCIVLTETTTSSRRRETAQERTIRPHNVEHPRNKTRRHADIIRRLTRWRHLYHRRANKRRRFRGFEQAIDRKLLLVGRWASVQWSTGGYDFGRQHSRNWTNNLFLQTFLHTMALSFFSRSPSVIYCIIYRHCKSSFSSFLNSFSKRPREKKQKKRGHAGRGSGE